MLSRKTPMEAAKRSSIHMRLGGLAKAQHAVGADGTRVLNVLEQLREACLAQADSPTKRGTKTAKRGDRSPGGRNQRTGSRERSASGGGGVLPYTVEDVDVLTDWVQDAMETIAAQKNAAREEVNMKTQFSKILDQSTQEYMLQMFTSNKIGRSNRTTSEQGGDGASSSRGGADAQTRVVGQLILCSPTAPQDTLQTTKAEHTLGRVRVVAGWMLKKGDTNKLWTNTSVRRRFFVLQGSVLKYYKSDTDLAKSAAPMRTIDLQAVVMMRATSDETAPAFTFDLEVRLQSSGTSRTFLFCPVGRNPVKLAWIARIAASVPTGCVAESIRTINESATLRGSMVGDVEGEDGGDEPAVGETNGNDSSGRSGLHGLAERAGAGLRGTSNRFDRIRSSMRMVGTGRNAAAPASTIASDLLTGWVFKKGETSKRWMNSSVKRRFFVLQGHYLKYFASDLDLDQSAPIKAIDLLHATALNFSVDDTAPAFALDLTVQLQSGYSRTFVFVPLGDRSTKLRWARAIANRLDRAAVSDALHAAVQELDGKEAMDPALPHVDSMDSSASAGVRGARAVTIERLHGNVSSHTGWMFKKGDTQKPWKNASIKRRFFSLENAVLSYYATEEDYTSGAAPLNAISMDQVLLLRYTNDPTAPPLAMDMQVPASAVEFRDRSTDGRAGNLQQKLKPRRGRMPRRHHDRTFVLSPAGEDWTKKNWGSVLCRVVPREVVSPALLTACSAMGEHEVDLDDIADRETTVSFHASAALPPLPPSDQTPHTPTPTLVQSGRKSQTGAAVATNSSGNGVDGTISSAGASVAFASDGSGDSDVAEGEKISDQFIDDGDDEDHFDETGSTLVKKPSSGVRKSRGRRSLSDEEVLQRWLQKLCGMSPQDSRLGPLLFSVKRLDEWDFDVFEVAKLTESPLLVVCMPLFSGYDLLNKFQIAEVTLERYLTQVQGAYRDNPYHNATHAADVTQTMNFFLSRGGLASAAQLSEDMLLGSIIAAVVHDVGHVGVNNQFLVSTGHELAIRYNDRSPMENMHCATAFELMRAEGCDILASLTHGQRMQVRRTILGMVLATDNAMHTEFLAKFNSKVDQDGLDLDEQDDQILTLQIALHAADVSNPAKPQSVYYQWKDRIMEEFYQQGDQERELGMQVTPFLDRTKPIPEHKFQSGFINGIVLPLYEAFSKVEGLNIDIVLQNLKANLRVFQNAIAADSTASIASTATASSLPRPASAATATPMQAPPRNTKRQSTRIGGAISAKFSSFLRKPKGGNYGDALSSRTSGDLDGVSSRSSPTPVR